MTPTADPAVRHCDGCHQDVHLCATLGDAEARARQGACIAVPGAVVAEAHERYTRMMVGRPHLPEVWARRIFAGG